MAGTDCQSPCEIVNNGWTVGMSYGREAVQETYEFLNSLSTAVSTTEIPSGDVSLTVPTLRNVEFQLPADVPEPNLAFGSIASPASPNIGSLSTLSIPSAPAFLATYPDITLPDTPQPLTLVAPTDVPSFTNPDTPDAPDVYIPPVPTLRDFNLPLAPSVDLPEFTHNAPTDNIGALLSDFSFSEDPYSSSVLTAVNTKLLYDIQNGTAGLPVAVETAIWDRARSRENAEAARAKRSVLADFAGRGFTMPAGVLEARLREAEEEIIRKNITLSRDEAINQAERALQQMQFALTTAVQLESQLINFASQVAQRSLEAATTAATVGIQIYQAKAQVYQIRMQAFNTYADIFKIRTEAELAKLDEYRALLEGQKLVGDLNLQHLEAYKSQLQGIESIVQVYRTEMEAAQIEADIQRTALQAFEARVNAYSAAVNAKTQEFQGYATQVQGEVAKIQLYEGEVNAYNSRVNAYRALVDAKKTESDANISVKQLQISKYQSDIQAFQANIAAEAARIGSQAQAFQASVQAFSAKVAAQSDYTRSVQAENESKVRIAGVEADVKLKSAEVEIQKSINALNAAIQAIQGGANVSSQLAASALSMVNLSGSISGSSDVSYNYSGTV